MKKYIILGCCIAFFAVLSILMAERNTDLRKELNEKQQNIETLIAGQKHYTINDSLNAVKIKALELSKDEAEKYICNLQKQIKQLDGNKKEKVVSYTEVTKHDTLMFPVTDTIYIKGDTCYGYNDKWLKSPQQATASWHLANVERGLLADGVQHGHIKGRAGRRLGAVQCQQGSFAKPQVDANLIG